MKAKLLPSLAKWCLTSQDTHSFDVQSKYPHLKCSGRDITEKNGEKGVHFL